MKVLVIYFSFSGNTKKIAQAIHDEVMDLGFESVLESLDIADMEEGAWKKLGKTINA